MAEKRKRNPVTTGSKRISEGAVLAEELDAAFPKIDLPIRPPFPPMEARTAAEIPEGSDWLYEPKWGGANY